MKKTISTTLLILLCLSISFAKSKIDKEEYSVFATVFGKLYENSELDRNITKFSISKNTIQPDYALLNRYLADKRTDNYLYSNDKTNNIERSDFEESLEDLKRANQNLDELENRIPIEYKYDLITKSELEALLQEGKKEKDDYYKKCEPCGMGVDDWQPFHRKYRNSNGNNNFSRVGFNDSKNLAVVFYKSESGDQSWSTFYVLGKTDAKWKVLKYFGTGWIN